MARVTYDMNYSKKMSPEEKIKMESKRVSNEIKRYIKDKKDFNFIRENIHSEIWDPEKLAEFVERRYNQQLETYIDQSIYPTTISGSIHGFIVGSTLGSVVWASSIFYFGKLPLWVLVFNFYIAYLVTTLMTGQTKNNLLVYIASLLATIASFFGGLYILELLGV